MEQKKFDAQSVLDAYQRFKTAKDSQEVKTLDTYLKSFQKSRDAWSISQEILMSKKVEEYVLLQSARTLKHKIEYDFAQLPQQDYAKQATLLITHIKAAGMKNQAILTQLTLALVYLYMRLFESWGKMTDFLKTNFANEPDGDLMILRILKQFPDEAQNDRVVIDDKHRERYMKYLRDNMEADVYVILDTFGAHRNKISETMRYEALKCMKNWVDFSTDEKILIKIANHSMIKLCFEGLESAELNQVAAETLESILSHVQMGAECSQEFYELFLLEVIKLFKDCDQVIKEELYDDAMGYIIVFVKFGKVFVQRFIYNYNDYTMKFLLYQLKITANIEIDNFDELTQFWDQFCKELAGIKDVEKKQTAIQVFKELLLELVKLCSERSVMSIKQLLFLNDHLDQDDEKVEEFEYKNKERLYSKELIQEIRAILGFKDPFVVLCGLFSKDIEALNQKNEVRLWAQFEARLYLMSYLLSELEPQEYAYLSDMLTIVLKLPITHTRIKNTIIAIVGKSSQYLATMTALMPDLFKFLASNLLDKKTLDYASKAICDLCKYSPKFVHENISDFFDLYTQLNQDPQILLGLLSAIKQYENSTTIKENLEQLCRPFAKRLLENLQKYQQFQQKTSVDFEEIEDSFDKLSLIAKELTKKGDEEVEKDNPFAVPFAAVFEQLWPVIETFFDKFQDNYGIVEKLCKFCKTTMRCIRKQFSPFAIKFFDIITRNYSKHIIPSYLYGAEVSVTVFSDAPEYDQYLRKMFDFMCEKTYNYVQDPDEDPDLIEDFFGMLTRYMRYMPSAVIESPTLLFNLRFAGMTIGMNQLDAAKCVISFIEMLFKCCSPSFLQEKLSNKLKEVMINQGFFEDFVAKLINECVRNAPGELKDYVFDCFYAATKFCKEPFVQCFSNYIVKVPADILTDVEKTEFVKRIYDAKPDSLRDLAEFCQHFGQRCKHSALRGDL